jgi:hypothetical protein
MADVLTDRCSKIVLRRFAKPFSCEPGKRSLMNNHNKVFELEYN